MKHLVPKSAFQTSAVCPAVCRSVGSVPGTQVWAACRNLGYLFKLMTAKKPKFQLLRHVTIRYARRVVRVARVVTSVTRLSCVSCRACSSMADDEEAVVLACTSLVYCALDLHQSQKHLLEKVGWTYPPQSTLWRRP